MIERYLPTLKNEIFDIIIIGGGITGCATAMDGVLRGLKVCMIEKNDFGCGTSAATSKLIHGGLRYLATADFGIVRECLRERRYLQMNAPHLVVPLPFLMPIFSSHGKSRSIMFAGFSVYDLLSYDRNRIPDKDKHMPRTKWLNKKKTLELESMLSEENLKGAFYYYDCASLHPDRLTLEFVHTAAEAGAVCLNHVKAIGSILKDNQVIGIRCRDEISGEELEIKGRLSINVGGPWAEEILETLGGIKKIGLKKALGIHLITDPILSQKECTLAISTKTGQHFFIIPWQGHSLIGTTDVPYEGKMAELRMTKAFIKDFMAEVRQHLPKINLEIKNIHHAIIGVRPLIGQQGLSSYKVSRKHEIFDHKKLGGREGVMTVIGGKYTTSRNLGEIIINSAIKKLSSYDSVWKTKNVSKSYTKFHVMFSGKTKNVNSFIKNAIKENPDMDDRIISHLIELYGSNYIEILELVRHNSELGRMIGPNNRNLPNIIAEIHHTVQKESALTLEDYIMRRSEIGNLGNPGDEFLNTAASEMGTLLNWDDDRKKKEIQALNQCFPMKHLTF
jgi:glycerol-3-phosphate dehydrogenase